MGRTTIRLADDLLKQAKKIAAESGRTLTSVIEDALRESFYRREQTPKKKRVRLPTTNARLHPGINFDSTAALLDAMDEELIDKLGPARTPVTEEQE